MHLQPLLCWYQYCMTNDCTGSIFSLATGKQKQINMNREKKFCSSWILRNLTKTQKIACVGWSK